MSTLPSTLTWPLEVLRRYNNDREQSLFAQKRAIKFFGVFFNQMTYPVFLVLCSVCCIFSGFTISLFVLFILHFIVQESQNTAHCQFLIRRTCQQHTPACKNFVVIVHFIVKHSVSSKLICTLQSKIIRIVIIIIIQITADYLYYNYWDTADSLQMCDELM